MNTITISKSELQAEMNSAEHCGFMGRERHSIMATAAGRVDTTEQGATDMSQYEIELMNLETREEPHLSPMDFSIIAERAENNDIDIDWVE